jgi:formate-dependent nitrite reductase membrane component NrfD
MPIFLFPLPVLAVAEIFYFIVSGKSNPPVRKAALAALIPVVLSILVCSVFILSRPAVVTGPNYSPDTETPAAPVPPLNIALVIGMFLIFIFFTILIAVAARREQRRRKNG